jgi:alpha-L-fucosidase 2
LYGLLFNMGRYLSIAAGRPQPEGAAPKSPMNLQGLWNQDRRPAWDCDFHLDLNLEMCYWGQDSANLGELMSPLMDWVTRLLPQARHSAKDIHGCRGALFAATCDNKTIGNIDNIGYCFTSTAAWLAQILWTHYEYSLDELFLRERLYPFLKEIGAFYDDLLTKDSKDRLVACPSCSPEMGVAGRDKWSVLSSTSAIDMELIREVYTHLIAGSVILNTDERFRAHWLKTLKKLPLPPISAEHGLCEWLESHEPHDAGHRHRSHLVGIVPGDRITPEDTPEYAEAVRKALTYRHKNGMGSSLSFSTVTDAMIYARLYDAQQALEQLDLTIYHNIMDNLLTALCDWRDRGDTLAWFGGHKVFQIEAGLGLSCAIAELLVHDRRGIIRLLPALPAKWAAGNIYGICTRGGFEVSVCWENNQLKSAEIFSKLGGVCRVMPFQSGGMQEVLSNGQIIPAEYKDGVLAFDTEPGNRYELSETL